MNGTLMKPDFYSFLIGNHKCVALYDGYHDHKLENMVTNAPRAEVEAALQALGLSQQFVTMPYTSLYVDTGVHRVLVDTGGGEVLDTTGNLLNNMHKAGIQPDSIDTVIITHAHPDHVGGLLDERGETVFPQATFYIYKTEWEFWFSEDAAVYPGGWMPEFIRNKLSPIKAQTVLLEREGEILPEVSVLIAPGHTPGHMVISFTSLGKQLLYTGDVALHPIHLAHPDWLAVFDITPEMAVASRRHIFDLAAATGCWVMGQQFPPFPSLGRVNEQEKGWEWQPIQFPEQTIDDHRRE
jgi:glyoxylase-like metal-dependent hydrolase (beta-lactamase superfamily II)